MKLFFLIIPFLISCQSSNEGESYTLYRNSVTDSKMRLHIATFNSSDGEAYNMENCNVAKDLFQAQPMVKTMFWCEKGFYKK